MNYPIFHYDWSWDLQASPTDIWPLVADTNRFNHDTGLPWLEVLKQKEQDETSARHHLRFKRFGVIVEWVEEPFEWSRPKSFSVLRRYSRGPVKEMRVAVKLSTRPDGQPGTRLSYNVWVQPSNLLGLIAIPLQIGMISKHQFGKIFYRYDRIISNKISEVPSIKPQFTPGGKERLKSLIHKLVKQNLDKELILLLSELINESDDLKVSRIRPFELAGKWEKERKDVLATCLEAVRAGLLEFQWDLLCPLCRGAKESFTHLNDVHPAVHCDVCNIDFNANFERSVELTFCPSRSVRPVRKTEFCVAGPQVTPHIAAQQQLEPGETRKINLNLETGSYRLRALKNSGGQFIRVSEDTNSELSIEYGERGWTNEEFLFPIESSLILKNGTKNEQLFILERMEWSDKAVTAAEVTSMQVFRDLFSSEALRPGENISVGSLTIVFTDLRDSTRMYRSVGDAPAFGKVMDHFDIVKKEIVTEDGSIVKTIGDAVMATFPTPDNALRAMIKAQEVLIKTTFNKGHPLYLKVGLHHGACIAVTQNERLDYFGTAVNLAARLVNFSTGVEIIISNDVYNDPALQDFFLENRDLISTEQIETEFKGFDDEQFVVWKIVKR